jgi:hypothetical protein
MNQETGQVTYFPRTTFNAIVRDCMEILRQRGFTPPTVTIDDTKKCSDVFEKWFEWFAKLEPKRRAPESAKRPHGLNVRDLNLISLECALVHIRHGVGDVHYNESLNNIRGTICDLFVAMDYERPLNLLSNRPHWACYKLWEEVARADGLAEEKVLAIRLNSKDQQPKFYEEK